MRPGESGALAPRGWERKLVQPPCKTVWRLLEKLKPKPSPDAVTAALGLYPKNTRTLAQGVRAAGTAALPPTAE